MSQLPGGWIESDFDTPPNDEESPDSSVADVFDDAESTITSSSQFTFVDQEEGPVKEALSLEPESISTSADISFYDAIASETVSDLATDVQSSSCRFNVAELLPIDMTDVEDTDWKAYAPPAELLSVPSDISMELETLMEVSLERLQDRLVEADYMREQAALEAREEAGRNKGKGKEVMREKLVMFKTPTDSAISMPPPTRKAPVPGEERTVNIYSPCSYLAGMEGNWSQGTQQFLRVERAGGISAEPEYASGSGESSSKRGRSVASTLGGLFRRSKRSVSTRVATLAASLEEDPSEPDSGDNIKECVSCLDDFDSEQTVHLTCHDYCKPCFETLIETAVATETYWPPKCCLNEILPATITSNISAPLGKKYASTALERAVPAGSRVYCSKMTCATFIPPANIDVETSIASCPAFLCRTKTCIHCRGPSHPTKAICPSDTALRATLTLAIDEGWKRCYDCQALVEHNQGCIHMTCKCKAQFCYICSKRWRTCACSNDDMIPLRLEAAARRQRRLAEDEASQRAAREEEEARELRELQAQEEEALERKRAEELAEIIREIEIFEAAEQAKADAEAESLRQAARRERERKQQLRAQEISRRFHGLREELDVLHAWQKISMVERYDDAIKQLKRETAARETREAELQRDLEAAEKLRSERLSSFALRRDLEFNARLSAERKLEKRYAAQLAQYWSQAPGVADPMAEVSKAREAYRAANMRAHREWELSVKNEYGVLMGEMDAAVRVLAARREEQRRGMGPGTRQAEDMKMRGFKRVRFADDKWLEAVAGVREEMLLGMEQEEYAREE